MDSHEKRSIPFVLMFGTSLSCSHVVGIVGLLKALHPYWSLTMIKSAIMTTVKDRNSRKHLILDYNGMLATPFAYSAGNASLNDAMDLGLVYELGFDDYLGYICNCGYDQSKIPKFVKGKQYMCPKSFNITDLNYHSITLPNLNRKITITRRVRNVVQLVCTSPDSGKWTESQFLLSHVAWTSQNIVKRRYLKSHLLPREMSSIRIMVLEIWYGQMVF